jgi:hypothetical protein
VISELTFTILAKFTVDVEAECSVMSNDVKMFSDVTGALRFIRLSELRYTHYYLLNNTSRSAPTICCQSKKRTWQVKGWTHIQSVLPVKRETYMCSAPLPFGKNLVIRVERLGIYVSTVSQSAMNQL